MTRKLLLAATVLAPFAAVPAIAQPVTGIYIGAGGGANFEQREFYRSQTLSGRGTSALFGSNSRDDGFAGVGSAGYGFGNGLRLEVEGDYRYNRISRATNTISSGGREQKYGPMFNVMFDLDVGSPYVFPYIGGGLGYQWVDRQRSSTSTDGYLTTTGTGSGLHTSFTNGSDSSFAYQAIAGLSFPVPPVVGLSLTAEYRFFALDGDRNFSTRTTTPSGLVNAGRIKVTEDFNHSLMLGVRYAFNVAPPPIVAAPPAAPARSEAARTYLVFFDWDRADLTERARQIIAEAAQATTRVQVTRIEVNGYTDTSGTSTYNQGLSVRRAQAVAAELVRDGVPRGSITSQGFGEKNLLVQTGTGVREPQNRRVEIILR